MHPLKSHPPPQEYLSYATCLQHLVCRGLARVWYSVQLRRVFEYLSLKNIVNYGVLPCPRTRILEQRCSRAPEVLVLGAGISGLATARQLAMNGARVTVLEAGQRLGGRMKDDFSLGVAVGCGAQLVTGVTNSPIILMCRQVGSRYR